MKRAEILPGLVTLGVSPKLLNDLPDLPPDVEGLLVYGSQARRDAVADSDLDLLALSPIGRSTTVAGDVHISYYSREQLSTGIGTLFGAHLKRDARILQDSSGQLTAVVEAMGDVDTDRLLGRARRMSELFTNQEFDLPKYLPGLLRQARYLLRSCLYAKAIAEGSPCFSIRELAVRYSDSSLTQLLASRDTVASSEDFARCLSRLQILLGPFPQSPHGSLEATIVNEWGQSSDILSMAFMALGATYAGSDYAEVEKVLL